MYSGVDVICIGLGNLLYCLGFIFAIFYLLRARHHPRWVLYALIAGGYALQTFGLYQRGLLVGGCPVGNTFEIVQFVIWSLTFCFLVLGPAFRLSLFGFSTAGLAVLLSVLSFAIPSWDTPYPGRPLGPSPWIEFHASLALFSYGIFGLLAVSSLLYLLQNFSLKERRLQGIYSFLPSLVETETLSLRMLVAGCSVLTASLVVGSIYWIQNVATVDWLKLIFTVSVWLAYLIVLILRLGNRLYSKKLAWTCLALFLVAVISLWPVNQSRANPETALPESSMARMSQKSSTALRYVGTGADFVGFHARASHRCMPSLQGVAPASPANLHETRPSTRPPFARYELCETRGLGLPHG